MKYLHIWVLLFPAIWNCVHRQYIQGQHNIPLIRIWKYLYKKTRVCMFMSFVIIWTKSFHKNKEDDICQWFNFPNSTPLYKTSNKSLTSKKQPSDHHLKLVASSRDLWIQYLWFSELHLVVVLKQSPLFHQDPSEFQQVFSPCHFDLNQ